MTSLPFKNAAFDHCAAVTSLCFVNDIHQAIAEMWGVSRCGIILGLLNRHSLLYKHNHGRGGYRGARWDRSADIDKWQAGLNPRPLRVQSATAVFFPGGGCCARIFEKLLSRALPWGGFLAAYLQRPG